MAKKPNDAVARGDGTVATIGVMLAAAASAFAGYMLLNRPSAPGGADFRLVDLAANRQNDGKPLGAEIIEADPVITGSTRTDTVITSPRDVPDWFERPGRPIAYRLLTVERNAAFVDVSSGADRFTYKVERGGTVPGIGAVQSIGRKDGRWQVLTERTRISDRGVELAGEANADDNSEPGK